MSKPWAGNWIGNHRLQAHLLVPAALSLLLIGMYFSGIAWLQSVVAPTVPGMQAYSWREFGILEWPQNLLLLGILYQLARSLGPVFGLGQRAVIALSRLAHLLDDAGYSVIGGVPGICRTTSRSFGN